MVNVDNLSDSIGKGAIEWEILLKQNKNAEEQRDSISALSICHFVFT